METSPPHTQNAAANARTHTHTHTATQDPRHTTYTYGHPRWTPPHTETTTRETPLTHPTDITHTQTTTQDPPHTQLHTGRPTQDAPPRPPETTATRALPTQARTAAQETIAAAPHRHPHPPLTLPDRYKGLRSLPGPGHAAARSGCSGSTTSRPPRSTYCWGFKPRRPPAQPMGTRASAAANQRPPWGSRGGVRALGHPRARGWLRGARARLPAGFARGSALPPSGRAGKMAAGTGSECGACRERRRGAAERERRRPAAAGLGREGGEGTA